MPRLAIRVVGMYLITVLDLRFLMQTSLCLPPSPPGYNQEECEGLVKLLPQMGCVWTSFAFDKDSGMEERFVLWALR